MTIGVACTATGRSRPRLSRDISLIGIDDLPRAEAVAPALTTRRAAGALPWARPALDSWPQRIAGTRLGPGHHHRDGAAA